MNILKNKDKLAEKLVSERNDFSRLYYQNTEYAFLYPQEDYKVSSHFLTIATKSPTFQIRVAVPEEYGYLEYSFDSEVWTRFDMSDNYYSSPNRVVYIRGKTDLRGEMNITLNDVIDPIFDGHIRVAGHLGSLIDYDNPDNAVMTESCFSSAFNHMERLLDASGLIFPKTVAVNCYNSMFMLCNRLVVGPSVLPATILAENCYDGMFLNATSLITVPKILATTTAEACCRDMFGSTSVTRSPELLSTVLSEECYSHMFSGCNEFEYLPKLPATVLAENCYDRMFGSCPKLEVKDYPSLGYSKRFRIPYSGTITLPDFDTGIDYMVDDITVKLNKTYFTKGTEWNT